MKIRFDNVIWSANNGPNGFAKKLAIYLANSGHQVVKFGHDVQLSFISIANKSPKTVLRLDGIFFNTSQNWMDMNESIKSSYEVADRVIFQSLFDQQLIFKFFGEREGTSIIYNGTCLKEIEDIKTLDDDKINCFDNVWMCASNWRPHKRLDENIRYYLEHSGENDCLLIAGDNPYTIHTRQVTQGKNVFYIGCLSWTELIAAMKKAKYFLHLAFLDHCPNVVVDAQACGCKVICSSSGGTKEIVYNGVLVEDTKWDFEPLDLYDPPDLDFSKRKDVDKQHHISKNLLSEALVNSRLDMNFCMDRYLEVLEW